MIRRSGVRPATLASNTARDTPRRSASGQSPARQLRKLAAAARIACAVISGGFEAPGPPLQSWTAAVGAGAPAAFAPGALNSVRMSSPWPGVGAAQAVAAKAAALRRPVGGANLAMAFGLDSIVACEVMGNSDGCRTF